MRSLLLAIVLNNGFTARAAIWEEAAAFRDDLGYSSLAPEEQQEYRDLVLSLAAVAREGLDDPSLAERARTLGLKLVVTTQTLKLGPAGGEGSPFGVLVLRRGPLPAELVLAAPHPFDDLKTGAIASAIFERAPIRAVHIATHSRNAGEGADPTRDPESALQIATEALAESLPNPWFVQIHGFGPATSEAAAVVSGGASATPREVVERAADILNRVVGGADVRTGRSVPALAARQNLQGEWLRGRAPFLHVELGRELRDAMEKQPAMCAALGGRLVEAARGGRAPGGQP